MSRFLLAALLALGSSPVASALELEVRSGHWAESEVEGIDPSSESFVIETQIDPVVAEGGDLQVVAGLVVGLKSGERVQDGEGGQLRADLREGGERSAFAFWHRKANLTMLEPIPKPPGWMDNRDFQHPHLLPFREGAGHRIKLAVWPEGEGSRVRLFGDHFDRPMEEHLLPERIRAGVVKLFTMRGGAEADLRRTSRFSEVMFRETTAEQARELPSMAGSVLRALDFSHPAMQSVARDSSAPRCSTGSRASRFSGNAAPALAA